MASLKFGKGGAVKGKNTAGRAGTTGGPKGSVAGKGSIKVVQSGKYIKGGK